MFCRGKKLVFLMFYFLCLYVLTFLFFYVHMFLVLMFLFSYVFLMLFVFHVWLFWFCYWSRVGLWSLSSQIIVLSGIKLLIIFKMVLLKIETCLFRLTLSSALFHSKLSFVHLVELAYDAIYFFWKEEDKKILN